MKKLRATKIQPWFLLSAAVLIAIASWLATQYFRDTWQIRMAKSMSLTMFPSNESRGACFGRMTLELPLGANMIGSLYEFRNGLGSNIEEHINIDLTTHRKIISGFEKSLKTTKHQKDPSLLKSLREIPDGRIFLHWEKPYELPVLRITGFRWIKNIQYQFSTDAAPEHAQELLDDMAKILSSLRPRSADEIPEEQGFCLNTAIILDDAREGDHERVDIAFEFDSLPEVNLNIKTFVNQTKEPQTLLQRIDAAREKPHFSSTYSMIRAGTRHTENLHGEEALALVKDGVEKYLHFRWEVEGALQRNDPPHITMDLRVGQNGKPGEINQEQALALWEYLLPRLKLRAVTAKPPTASVTGERTPLGTLQASGRTCPQTGWWECDDPLPLAQASSGVWLEEGQRMPMARVWLRPGWWQRWKDERSVGERAAVWRLAAYEAPGPAPSPSRE